MKKKLDVKINIPTQLNDIKLSTYQNFIKDVKDEEDNDKVNRAILRHFCNLDYEIIDKIKKSDYNHITERIQALLALEPELKPIIRVNGIKYGFIPNMENITVAEQADIDSCINDVQKWDQVVKVCYRPIKEEWRGKYTIEDYLGNEQPPIEVDLETAFGLVFFFVNTLNDLLRYIPSYLTKEVRKDKKLLTSLENGIGIRIFTNSLEEAFSILTK